jgi:hypothetical protein
VVWHLAAPAALGLTRGRSACFDLMNDFPTAATVKAAIRAHLIGGAHRDAFVDVYLVPGKEESIYIITTEASLVLRVQSFLEDRLGRSGAYVQGSFLVYGKEVARLLR